METGRHLVVPGMQLRLGLLLLVAELLGERTDDITDSPTAADAALVPAGASGIAGNDGSNGHGDDPARTEALDSTEA
jgi:hypothetical protein